MLFRSLAVVTGLPTLAAVAGGLPAAGRYVLAAAVIAPLGFLMGLPMPMGLTRLAAVGAGQDALIPWAWGINGFASVLAPPLALAAAMTWSYLVVAMAAVALYSGAALIFGRLPADTSPLGD